MADEQETEIISRWNSTDVRKEYADGYRLELLHYLSAVDKTHLSIHSADTPNDKNKAISFIQTAMARLVDEFHNILKLGAMSSEMITSIDHPYQDTHSSTITDSPSSYYYEFHEDDFIEGNIASSRVICDLQSIAMTINNAGYLHDCVQVYTSVRSSIIASSFQRLHVQKLSKRDAQTLDWGSLGTIIRNWNRSARVLIISIFPNEKRLCEEIFNGVGNATDDACFTKIVKDPAIQLFDIAEALTSVQPSPEKLFRTLDLYETFSRILPLILTLFNSESSEFLTIMAANLLPKMAEAVRGILYAFENDVLHEQSPVSRVGKIHSLTRYVINHVLVMCDYKQTLTVLITSMTPLANETGGVKELLAEFEKQTPLSLYFIWIIMSLITNLETKAKIYEDTALGHFFIMNNVHYIVQNVVSSPELSDMIGDEYREKLIGILYQVKADYVSLTLEKILYSLRVNEIKGLLGMNIGICIFRVSKARKRSKAFRLLFKKIQKDFERFAIWDYELLDDLRKSISENLIPAYSSFLGHFQKVTGSTNNVKYSAMDLEAAIFDLGPKSSSL